MIGSAIILPEIHSQEGISMEVAKILDLAGIVLHFQEAILKVTLKWEQCPTLEVIYQEPLQVTVIQVVYLVIIKEGDKITPIKNSRNLAVSVMI